MMRLDVSSFRDVDRRTLSKQVQPFTRAEVGVTRTRDSHVMSFDHDERIAPRVISRSTQTGMKIESIMKIESVRFRVVPGELMNQRRTPVLYAHGRSLTQGKRIIGDTLLVPQAQRQTNTKLKEPLELVKPLETDSYSNPPGAHSDLGFHRPNVRCAISAHAAPGHRQAISQYRLRR